MSIGTNPIENYIPAIKYNEGFYTALPVTIASDLIVTGTTTIGGITLVDLTVTGNTVIGNAATDTLAVTGVSTFVAGATTDAITVTGAAVTSGKGLVVTDLALLTTGLGLSITSAATAITGAGRLVFSNHTGATGTSAILNEFASAANDETVIVKVTASAANALGTALQVATAATTGTGLTVTGTAFTTGGAATFTSSGADTGTRSVVAIAQSNASASGATPLTITASNGVKPLIAGTATAATAHFFKFATVNGVTLWMGDGTTANTALSGTAGDLLLNGGSGKPEYCTGTTSWTALV